MTLRLRTVKLLDRFLRPLVDEGVIHNSEAQEILTNLKYLATKGELIPPIPPRLLCQREVAELLGIGLSNFKKLEYDNEFPFKRKMIGASIRYRNLDVFAYILANDASYEETEEH